MKTKLFFLTILISYLSYGQSFELFDFNNSGDFSPKYFTKYNGVLFFQAKDSDGVELWKTDGTQSGTLKIKDINTNGSSNPRNFFTFNNNLYFIASSNNTTSGELWKTDGTEAGTSLVSNQVVPQGSFAVSNNLLFFVGANSANGKELWKTDGTQSGTVLVKDINPSTWDALQFNSQLIAYDNMVIFSANDGTNGKELWKSDGTEAGTEIVKNIRSGSEGSNPSFFIEYKGKIYFAASDLQHGNELWKTDGTSNGTELVENNRAGDFSSNPSKFVVYSESLFFQAESDDEKGIEMHRYNLTTDAVQRVVDIYDGEGNGGFSPALEYNNGLYFTATKPATGNELYVRRNGSTILSEDVYPGSNNGSPTAFCNCGNKMYFRAYDGNENALFEFDTSGNATKIKPSSATNEPFFISTITELFCFNDALFFAANYTSSGFDLWKYSNTTLSTENIEFYSKKVSLFPNPAEDTATISLRSNNDFIKRIELYNLIGKKVYETQAHKKESKIINTSQLKKGIYIVKVKGENYTYSNKLIIK